MWNLLGLLAVAILSGYGCSYWIGVQNQNGHDPWFQFVLLAISVGVGLLALLLLPLSILWKL